MIGKGPFVKPGPANSTVTGRRSDSKIGTSGNAAALASSCDCAWWCAPWRRAEAALRKRFRGPSGNPSYLKPAADGINQRLTARPAVTSIPPPADGRGQMRKEPSMDWRKAHWGIAGLV